MDVIAQISPPAQPAIDPDSAVRLNELVQTQIKACLEAVRTAQLPTPDEVLQKLTSMDVLTGIILCTAGLLYLLMGWRIFKVLLIVNAGIFGALFGGMLTIQMGYEQHWWIGTLGGGLILAILAWPLVKIFLALFGASIGASVGYIVFQIVTVTIGRGDLLPFAWCGAIGGAILMFLLVLLNFRSCVIVVTALQGAVTLSSGALSLMLKLEKSRPVVIDAVKSESIYLPIGVFGLALLGLVYQCSRSAQHRKKLAKAKQAEE